jgi:hypothetical protein
MTHDELVAALGVTGREDVGLLPGTPLWRSVHPDEINRVAIPRGVVFLEVQRHAAIAHENGTVTMVNSLWNTLGNYEAIVITKSHAVVKALNGNVWNLQTWLSIVNSAAVIRESNLALFAVRIKSY